MKKDKEKAVAVSNPNHTDEDACDYAKDACPAFTNVSSLRNTSKYDFVKVRVWLGENADHYYVFSRFLLSRMLTVTKIPNHVAIKVALELKKLLIDNSLLDVSQSDLEANLFKLMVRRGYGEEYVNRYKMMTRFHHQRVPLVILVCGTACVGKSTIATQLAQRLNLPNVLQTDMVYELLRTSTEYDIALTLSLISLSFLSFFWWHLVLQGMPSSMWGVHKCAPLTSTPIWERDFSSSEELITEFCRECRVVRKGLAGDLKKAMKDGKPIIIEGTHLDPSIYLMDDENKLVAKNKEENPASTTEEDKRTTQMENKSVPESYGRSGSSPYHAISDEGVQNNQMNEVLDSLGSIALSESGSRNRGETEKDTQNDDSASVRKEKSGAEPIIIPIVLKMAEFDHKALLEEWISSRSFSDSCLRQDKDKLITNLKTIQDYLCSFKSQGLTVVNISATTFPQILDWLHGYLLECIENGLSSASGEKS